MGWIGNIRAAIGRVIGGAALREAAIADEFADKDEHEFRKLKGSIRVRELPEITRRRQLEVVTWLYWQNPIAHRIIELNTDFVIGKGVSYKAKDKRVQQVLDAHWNDPINQWPLKQFERVRQLGLYGEECFSVAVNEQNGHVRLAYLDPIDIIERHLDPKNAEIVRELEIDAKAVGDSTTEKGAAAAPARGPNKNLRLQVIRLDEEPASETAGVRRGDVFFFRINHVSNQPHGNSDLLPIIDWLDTYDQLLFRVNERVQLLVSVVWDILVKGASEKQLKDLMKKYGPVRAGMNRWHNEKMEISAIVPELGSAEIVPMVKLFLQHIATGAGYPEHYLGEGGDVNLATARAMGTPTIRRLETRQLYVKEIFRQIFDFVIDQAVLHGRLDENIDRDVTIDLPRIIQSDTTAASQALVNTANALTLAETLRALTPEEQARVFRHLVEQLGIDLADELPDELPETGDEEPPASTDPKMAPTPAKDAQGERITASYRRRMAELGRRMKEAAGA